MRRATALLALLAACAGPRSAPAPAPDISNLRACVEGSDDAALAAWAARFAAAARLEDARPARDCDFIARAASALDAGTASLRSAFDGSPLAELSGEKDMLPALAALALAPGTEARLRLDAQRKAANFSAGD